MGIDRLRLGRVGSGDKFGEGGRDDCIKRGRRVVLGLAVVVFLHFMDIGRMVRILSTTCFFLDCFSLPFLQNCIALASCVVYIDLNFFIFF